MSLMLITGIVMFVILTWCLLKNKFPPSVLFIILPTVAALVCGFGFKELGEYVASGLKSVVGTATLVAFSAMFFTLMKEAGVFDVIVRFILRFVTQSTFSVLLATLVIASVCSLDGNAYATLLVTVPALLPLYEKMNISRKTLLMLVTVGVGVTGITPWGGSLNRAIAVTHLDILDVYYKLIPLQVVLFVLGVILCWYMARVENKSGSGISKEAFLVMREEMLTSKGDHNPWLLRANFVLVIATIVILVSGLVAGNFLFMIAFSLAVMINYPDAKKAQQKIKDYALTIFPVIVIFLTIGVFVGILQNTGIIKVLVNELAAVLPSSLGPYLYIILAAFSVPIVILIGSDAFYFALLPLAVGLGQSFDVSPLHVTIAMLITEQIGLLLSPVIPATHLGLGLLNLQVGEHIRHSMVKIWIMSVCALLAAVVLGIIPV
ncbi:citrate-Mg2+:H+ or citrate-Ca2+:H+ symporter, CitMHS family [Candidatus Pantoea symbiotica]|uniref:Citrate-Mg2+:H+ or citrate-Ca2+:H+ symporter, CitMHS family n=1 Tax=Candidatus Pantoea symbiotica TaxID=1884370 RepID=A0A1I3V7K3_9GAMM|nr:MULTISPECIES: SLC13 family permease [Pantoea]EJL91408.1 H+/citrate symporter [Pantoea sp. GM01]KAJ9434479.1 SLC13 family permease [Pantoea sp. YR343]SFJ91408.1 citrate-Mg2+:H+ or citrate-Ca2+:H+ symporter, CitMHS family [Pantoea symbiotica]SFU63531.1 citrate-Mg2+:H+ or citrate-Ca2+:H+ symporter, CitMHS family [Pantoea sp. YR525]